jgi:U3 small nucleolar ribonucleoprotein component
MESSGLTTPFQQAIEMVEHLSTEDQENLIEIIRQRLIEQRRAEMARNARATLQAFREERARYGTIDDLRRDLLDEA